LTTVEDAAKSQPSYVAPCIGAYRGIGVDNKYFIFVENLVLCQCSSVHDAVFFMFTAYYSFYLDYSPQTRNFMWFLQDYIFSYPDSTERTASYLVATTDMKRNLST